MFNKIEKRIRKEQFEPGLLALFINPFYFARKGLFKNINFFAKYIDGKTLDVGCGKKPYEKIFRSTQYIGLEIDTIENRKNKKAEYFYDGNTFPFFDKEYDSVVVNQVLEHVFNPHLFLSEVNRIIKNGGILLITVPFVWDEHEQPSDYARYSSFGLRYILEDHGFAVIEQRKSVNDIRVLFQILNGYLYKKILTQNNYLNVFLTILLISPFNLFGELLSKIMPQNDDLYLDNIILAKKIRDNYF